MKDFFSLPFRSAPIEAVQLGPWHYKSPEGIDLRLEGQIPGWDYDFQLILRRHVEIDLLKIRQESGLQPDAPIDLVVVGASPIARFRSFLTRVEGCANPSISGMVAVRLPSPELASYVIIESELILAADLDSEDHFTPHLKGSRLFSEEFRFDLEGTAGRFPIEVVDFNSVPALSDAKNALWNLFWNASDLEQPFMGNLQLLINSRNPDIVQRGTVKDPDLTNFLAIDVTRQIITGALESEPFLDNPSSFSEGSLGEVAFKLIQLCFPNRDVKSVRHLYIHDSASFESMIQSGIGNPNA